MSHTSNLLLPPPTAPGEGHSSAIYTLSLHPPYLVSGSADHSIRIWDITTSTGLKPIREPLVGHEASIASLHFKPLPEQDIIISGDAQGCVIIWRFSTGKVLQKIEDAHGGGIMSLVFSNEVLVTGGRDGRIRVWTRNFMADDADDDDDEAVGISDQDVISSTPITLNGHTASVNSLCISDDGERFFSGSGDRSIVIWNLRSNREEAMRKICIHEGGILDLCCHGDFLVSASSDATVRIFDLGRNEQVGYLKGHQGVVSCVGVVPGDGSLGEGFDVVSGGYDGTVRYWRCRVDGEWEARVIWSSISLGVEEDDGNGSSAVGEAKDKTLMISDLEVGDGKVFVARFRAGIEIVDIQSRTRVT